MGLKDFIGRKILQWKGEKQLNGLMEKVNGYKTYITLSLGAVIVIVGHFWGPLHVGTIDIPSISSADMWKVIWEASAGAFLRHGVSKP